MLDKKLNQDLATYNFLSKNWFMWNKKFVWFLKY